MKHETKSMRRLILLMTALQVFIAIVWVFSLVASFWILPETKAILWSIPAGYGGGCAITAIFSNWRRLRKNRVATITQLITGQEDENSFPAFMDTYLRAFKEGAVWCMGYIANYTANHTAANPMHAGPISMNATEVLDAAQKEALEQVKKEIV